MKNLFILYILLIGCSNENYRESTLKDGSSNKKITYKFPESKDNKVTFSNLKITCDQASDQEKNLCLLEGKLSLNEITKDFTFNYYLITSEKNECLADYKSFYFGRMKDNNIYFNACFAFSAATKKVTGFYSVSEQAYNPFLNQELFKINPVTANLIY